jgi:hypothetical protein
LSGLELVLHQALSGLHDYKTCKYGGKTGQKAKTLIDAYCQAINDIYPTPSPSTTPSPGTDTRAGGFAICEYSCPLLAKGEAIGKKACLYGDCTNPRKTGGSVSVHCPANLPGTMTVLAQEDKNECLYCGDPLIESRTYEPGKPIKDQKFDGFEYSGW